MKTFEEFVKDFAADEALKAKAKEALESAEDKSEEEKAALLVKFAAENGYSVTAEDFAKKQADSKELNENELASVAGGGRRGGDWCMIAHYCVFVLQ